MTNQWEEASGLLREARPTGKQDAMNDHRWRELCQLIMNEKDPQRLLQLVRELNQEFERREKQLRSNDDYVSDQGPDGCP